MTTKFRRTCLIMLAILFSQAEANAADFTEINSIIPSEGTDTTYVSGFSFNNKQVTYAKKEGLAVFESDIVLGTIEEAESWKSLIDNASGPSARSIIITGDRYRWPNNIVPYQFSANANQAVRDLIERAIVHWEENTNIRFVFRDATNANQYHDFVNINSNQFACWSFVGRIGGQQTLNLVQECGFGASVHELGHALGLWHEQSREDRNNFVRINWNNIIEEQKHNFNQHINDADDINGYDYGSIMHYGAFAFSSNGNPTITPLQNVAIGQRAGLSSDDITSINETYPPIFPVAMLDKEQYSIFLGNAVFLDGRNSFDPDGGSLQFDWDLGDGTSVSHGASFLNHTYSDRGSYDIALTVYDPDGYMSQDFATAFVYGYEAILPAITSLLLN